MTLQVLLNESATVNPALTKDLIDMWVPRCYRQGPGPACVHSCLFMHTLTVSKADEDLESAAVSPTFRRAKLHLLPSAHLLHIYIFIFIFRKIKSDRALQIECTDHNLQFYGHQINYEDRDTTMWGSHFTSMFV